MSKTLSNYGEQSAKTLMRLYSKSLVRNRGEIWNHIHRTPIQEEGTTNEASTDALKLSAASPASDEQERSAGENLETDTTSKRCTSPWRYDHYICLKCA